MPAEKDTSQPQPANLSEGQVREAIPKLQRRIDELEQIRTARGKFNEENYKDVLNGYLRKIDATLIEVFGYDSLDYRKFVVSRLDTTPLTVGRRRGVTRSFSDHLPGIRAGINSAIAKLRSAIDILSERIEPEVAGPGQVVRAYQGLELHSEIARAASGLFRDGHYSNAVEAAVKALNDLVRLRSGLSLDGTTLIEHAFSLKNPVLRFNGLSDKSDEDEQIGFMMLFKGAVAGLRNPRAHSFINDEPERALEFIAFVSLLAKLLDEAERNVP